MVEYGIRLATCGTPCPHGFRELVEHREQHLPAHATVGHTLAVGHLRRPVQLLPAVDEETFEHDAGDAPLPSSNLTSDFMRHHRLAAIVFRAIAMARIDHEPGRRPASPSWLSAETDAGLIEVWTRSAAAKNHMGVAIAARFDDCGLTLLGDAHEVMRPGRGRDCVESDLDIAAGPVLESNRHRKARRQIPMHLALGGARADRRPGHRVRNELRGDRVEKFATSRNPRSSTSSRRPRAIRRPSLTA